MKKIALRKIRYNSRYFVWPTRGSLTYRNCDEADGVLKSAHFPAYSTKGIAARRLPEAVAVLRFHGFEVEVEE